MRTLTTLLAGAVATCTLSPLAMGSPAQAAVENPMELRAVSQVAPGRYRANLSPLASVEDAIPAGVAFPAQDSAADDRQELETRIRATQAAADQLRKAGMNDKANELLRESQELIAAYRAAQADRQQEQRDRRAMEQARAQDEERAQREARLRPLHEIRVARAELELRLQQIELERAMIDLERVQTEVQMAIQAGDERAGVLGRFAIKEAELAVREQEIKLEAAKLEIEAMRLELAWERRGG